MQYNEVFREAKYKDFQKYLNITGETVQYNGELYILYNQDKVVTTGATSDEIHSYIIGYFRCYEETQQRLSELNEQNRINVENYERIIQDLEGKKADE